MLRFRGEISELHDSIWSGLVDSIAPDIGLMFFLFCFIDNQVR